jgi:predicted RNA methylase
LVEDLVRLNESGFATLASQPGTRGELFGMPVEQRAYVDGVADASLARMVVDVAAGTELWAIALPAMQDTATALAISRGSAGNHAWGGVERASDLVDIVSPEVVDWRDTWKVLVVDPEWGRPRVLWDLLRSVTG